MEVVELKVQVEKSQLAALEKDIKALQSKRIKLSVDASGFNALSKSTQSAMRNVTQYVNAVTRAQDQETKLQVARERTAAATQQRMRAETNLARQIERTKTAQADATVQAQKTAQAQARVAQQMEKTKTAQAQYATQVEKTATAQAKAVNQTEKVSKSTSLLGDSLGNVAVKMAAWQVMGDLVATPIRALKEALDTMKAVDDQLVDVRKVTGFTEAQMKALEEQSYATASAYGEAADEYLGSVAEFARAGYGDQAKALAELSAKTKIVGGTTAEVANQFLLSVDAAYQYQGSVEKLGAVLDGVNEIDNKYATSISNIAEGLGKVAPIASQAGVGVDELSAAIGTITAVTQRSGTEAATAFRALMLNIMGDTKTEIDEGVTWTTGEIAGLRDVLKIYASDVVEAADATGSLINPMEAIGALAQSMEDGVLTEQKLMEMVSDIGGKLRTSQLLALIQNWDMYESMLADFSNAAGSADKEVENAMDSWSRKAEVLKNTWTQFVQGMLSTDTIKGGIDGLTAAISALDSGMGHAVIGAIGFALAIEGISKAAKAVKGSNLVGTIGKAFQFFGKNGFSGTISKVASVISKLPAPVAIAAAAITGLVVAAKYANEEFDRQAKKLNELQTSYDELWSEDGELAGLQAKIDSSQQLTDLEEKRYNLLMRQSQALEAQLKEQQKVAFEAFDAMYGSGRIVSYGDMRTGDYRETTFDVDVLEKTKRAQDELNQAFMSGSMNAEEYMNGLVELTTGTESYYENLKAAKDAGIELTDAQNEFIQMYEHAQSVLSETSDEMLEARLIMENWTGAYDAENLDEGIERTAINVAGLRDRLMEAGMTAEEVEGLLSEMGENEVYVMFDVEGDPQELAAQLEEVGVAAQTVNENGEISYTIEYDNFEEFAEQMGLTASQAENLATKLGSMGNVDFTNAEGQILEFQDVLAGLEENKTVTITTNADGALEVTENTMSELSTLDETTSDPTINVDNTAAMASISAVSSALSSLTSQTYTVKINVQQNGSVPSMGQNAKGTQNFSGGLTLLGDEPSPSGTPKPELVVANGTAFLAGMDGPEVQNLPRGAQIYSYGDTKKILGKNSPGGKFPAFAKGSENLWGYWQNWNANSGSGGSSSSSSGSSASGSSGNSWSSGTSSSGSTSRSKKSRGSSSSSSGKDARQEELEDQVKLLESELDLMEAQGKPARELAAKMREIQRALKTQADYMRSIGGDQTEINKLSKEWWDIQKDIKEAYQDEMQSQRDLLESQLELMENQGRSAEERIRKLEEIQDNLHEEAEYLRSIGASQEEINELSNEWWDIQNDIKDIQEDLWDELEEAVDKELERAREARDLELAALDKAKEELDEKRKKKEEELELEEKLLAVEEAREALANAQNERTIRTYNAATGQWEWVADANTVKNAEEALEDAEEDLEDYKADLEYQAAVDAIEARREAIEDAYDAIEQSWEDIIDSVQEPTREISDILADLAKNGTPLMKQQIDEIGQLLGSLNDYIYTAISPESGESYYGGGGMPSMDFSHDTTDYADKMMMATDVAAFNHWASLRKQKIEAQGIDLEAEGWKTNEELFGEWKASHPGWEAGVGSSAGVTGGGSPSGGSGSGGGKVVASVNGKAPPGLSVGDKVVTQGGTFQVTGVNKDGSYTSDKVSSQNKSEYESSGGKYDKYDSGGILRGLGGIKATEEDEMILPPEITAAMLSPAADTTFQARLAELGVLYGAKSGPVTLPAGISQNRDSHDHHGDSYTFGDVTLTEEQARGMTVYDLAQRSRSLGLYGWQH